MKSINLMKNVGRFTPPPPEIAKSDLPSNHLYDLPSNHLYNLPPPKSPSPIYPQIICTIYPPRNCQVQFTLKSSVRFTPPEIAKSDLPSNRLYDLPTNRLYDLPSNHLYNTDQEMIEYANKNIEHELKDNTGSIDNNQKSSSSKQNDQVHKGSPKKSKSDDESSSELNSEQALEYLSQDSEDESKIKPNTTDNNQKSCSPKHNDQTHENPKKSKFDGFIFMSFVISAISASISCL